MECHKGFVPWGTAFNYGKTVLYDTTDLASPKMVVSWPCQVPVVFGLGWLGLIFDIVIDTYITYTKYTNMYTSLNPSDLPRHNI